MFLDIDKFKRINDTHGHQAGDEVLKSVAKIIQSQLRAGETIARYGGEEFVVLLPHTEMHHARLIAERIRSCIAEENLHTHSEHSIKLTISIGLSMLPAEDMAVEMLATRLVAAADKALYQAKHSGRNRVVCDGGQPLESSARHALWYRILRPFTALASRLIQAMPEVKAAVLKYFKRA